jgi:histidine triad (HIT) family protein
MTCPFCAILSGENPAEVVFEDDISIAFLDKRPIFAGHTLISPKGHFETLPDLPPELVGPLFLNAQLLAAAVREGTGAEGTFVAINNRVSQSVPQLHVHVVPRTKGDGLKGFFWPRHRYASDEEAASVAERIRAAVEELRKEG